jgi:hypothetical protein
LAADAWHGLRSAIARQHDALPKDSPRIKPTLPALRFMRDIDADLGGAA